jgi:hypothetical protein
MSTILKALKKLEEEQAAKLTEGVRPGTDFSTRQVVNRTVRFAWLKRVALRWLTIGVAITAVMSVAYFLGAFYLKSDSRQSQRALKTVTSDLGAEESAKANSQRPVKALSDRANSSTVASTNNTPRDRHASAPSLNSTARLPSKKPMPRQERIQLQGAANPPGPAAKDNLTPSQAPEKPFPSNIPNKAASSSLKMDAQYADAMRLSDGRLKIQAIAWAPNIEDRMAVINNRIVHEGDSLGSFSILAINEDDVIVRGEGQTWKVLFGQP